MKSVLEGRDELEFNDKLVSPNGKYTLHIDQNRGMDWREGDKSRWKWDGGDAGTFVLRLEGSNLVSYSYWRQKTWSSNTGGNYDDRAKLTAQDNGELVLTCGERVLWSVGKVTDRISAGQIIGKYNSITSPNGKVTLTLETGRMVIRNEGNEVWSQQSGGVERLYYELRLDKNGNASLDGPAVRWESGSKALNPSDKVELIVLDVAVVIIQVGDEIVWSTDENKVPLSKSGHLGTPIKTDSSRIGPGQYLAPGLRMMSLNKQYTLGFQEDGSLALTREPIKAVVWVWPSSKSAAKVSMNTGRELAMYDKAGQLMWSSPKSEDDVPLILDDDGSLFVEGKQEGNARWLTRARGSWYGAQWDSALWFPASYQEVQSLNPGQAIASDQILIRKNSAHSPGYNNWELSFDEHGTLKLCHKTNTWETWKVDGITHGDYKPATTTKYYYTNVADEMHPEPARILVFSDDKLFLADGKGTTLWSVPSVKYSWSTIENEYGDGPAKLWLEPGGDLTINFLKRKYWSIQDLPSGDSPTRSLNIGNRLCCGPGARPLYSGEFITSPNGNVMLKLQRGGELALLSKTDGEETTLWKSGSDPVSSTGKVVLQSDGRLVMTDVRNKVKWVWKSLDNSVEIEDEAMELVVLDEGKAQLLDKDKKVLWTIA